MKSNLQNEIKKYYGSIAKSVSNTKAASCCSGLSCCNDSQSDLYSAEYIAGLPKQAINASLGCANPIALANLQEGEVVLDLGSGGGIDVLISAKFVGETGKAYGLDMTDEMLELANENKKKSKANNVEFLKGYLEDIPLDNETVDVVTSNCVINLTEDKRVALQEAYRVLKTGGRLAIADIIEMKSISNEIRENVQMWVGCISGALNAIMYEQILREVGFKEIEITPVNVYTKEMIKSIAESKDLGGLYDSLDENVLDGAFAGAHVKAVK